MVHRVAQGLLLLLFSLLTGCAASYTTPSRGADLRAIGVTPEMRDASTDAFIRQALDRKPLAQFPTGLAVARIESPRYHTGTAESWGNGAYSVVTTRDIEKPEHTARLEKLPQVFGVAPIGRLLLPSDLKSDAELRKAAAGLGADVLLIYTIDTAFYSEDESTPLTLISLGLFPTHGVHVVTTASAVFMDTRNGYIYGVAEASDRTDPHASAWNTSAAIDRARCQTESAAFEKLVGELETSWAGILRQYARAGGAVR